MTIFHQDDHLDVHIGDCRTILRTLPAESVHCVVTSPPYWGLRDYGTASWAGGDVDCDHVQQYRDPTKPAGSGGVTNKRPDLESQQTASQAGRKQFRVVCGKCGATRIDSQLGLEPTPEAFIAAMVEVFREVARVLRKDGTLWLNMGDSYAATTNGGPAQSDKTTMTGGRKDYDLPARSRGGLKPKDLVGMPWRLAFALQADGWYLRSDIIWSKPNPMPESVTDRPTKSHEYVFLLTKSARYYYDAEAVREPSLRAGDIPGGDNGRANGEHGVKPHGPFNGEVPAGRNLRSVWSIATEPYPGAHFATFPQKLVEPCIKAGTSERGVCPECGAPWVREVDVEQLPTQATNGREKQEAVTGWDRDKWPRTSKSSTTTGWKASCDWPGDPVPATVLDPFAGSGTTGLVANRLGRRAILIDLSADYIDQAMLRNQQHPLGLIG